MNPLSRLTAAGTSGARKQLLLALPIVLLLGAGCAQQYQITTYTGGTLMCKGRPKLENGYYVFKDGTGKEQRINALRVRAIEVQ